MIEFLEEKSRQKRNQIRNSPSSLNLVDDLESKSQLRSQVEIEQSSSEEGHRKKSISKKKEGLPQRSVEDRSVEDHVTSDKS